MDLCMPDGMMHSLRLFVIATGASKLTAETHSDFLCRPSKIYSGLIPLSLSSLVSGLQSIGAPQAVTDWFLSCLGLACNS
jgi:hypothetical protein